jgi:hypothetical protein
MLSKVWQAFYYSDRKHSFYNVKVAAPSHADALEKAIEWAEEKFPNRNIVKIEVERSKGEILA